MPKEKRQKDKQRSTKYTHKTKDRVTWTPQKTGGELRFSGRVIRGKHSWFDALTRNTFYFIIFWKLWKLKYDTNMFTTVRVKCTIMITTLCVKCTTMIITLCAKCTIMITTLCVKCTIMITTLCVKCTLMITTLCVKCPIYTWSSPRAPLL
jgi:hypothetical protein